jgi:glycosyltransferase involved in cell wall biosynthesis
VEIVRVGGTRFGRGSLPGRVLDYASFVIGARRALKRSIERGDVVVCKTDPPLLGAWLGPAIRARGGLLVQWLQDVFPEVASALGVGVRLPGLHPLLRALRDSSLARSAAVVTIGERMRSKVLARGAVAATTRVIPNWTDTRAIVPVDVDNALRRAWGLEERFVVGYSGNLGRVHRLDGLLEAASLLADRREIAFLFVGAGVQREYLAAQARARGLVNMRFEPYQSREDLAQSLSVPDVHVVSLNPALEGLVVPSKVYGAMAAGRPVLNLGAADGEIAELISRYDCGVSCDPSDGVAIARAVDGLCGHAHARREMGRRAREAALSFDRDVAIAGWAELLESLAPSGDGNRCVAVAPAGSR